MADETGESKSSGLRTFLWGAGAVAAAWLIPGGGIIMGAIRWGVALFAGFKAWESHKENQAIEAMEESQGAAVQGSGISRQQERAAAIAQMQSGQTQDQGTYWRDRARAQSADRTI